MNYIDPPRKLHNHLDRLDSLKRGMVAPPINVEIDLSNRCQLGCEWCDFSHCHDGRLMESRLAERLLQELALYGVRSITWTGGGEPLTHPDADTIFMACRVPQGLYTNGIHAGGKTAAVLKRVMTWVYVSIDEADALSYRQRKHADAFNVVCDSVRDLVAAEGDATIGVGFLLGEHNWRDMQGMATLARSLGADYVQFRPMVQFDQDAPGRRAEDTAWMDEPLAWLRRLGTCQDVYADLERFRMYRDWQGHGYHACWWSALQTVITPDGRVWGCCNKRGVEDALLGDLAKQSFADIWQKRPVQRVDEDCRVLCRGHVPNVALGPIMAAAGPHGAFV